MSNALLNQLDKMVPAERQYILGQFPSHLAASNQVTRLKTVLTAFDFLSAKLDLFGPEALVADYQLVNSHEMQVIGAALKMSSYILTHDKSALCSQLIGRLFDYKDNEMINLLLRRAKERAKKNSPLPLNATHNQAGGALLRTFVGHTGWIHKIVFSPDMRLMVTASNDDTLRIWNINSGMCCHVLRGHQGGCVTATFSPDGKYIISGGDDGVLRLWDSSSGSCLHNVQAHKSSIMSLAIDKNGKQVLSGSEDGTLRLWDAQQLECMGILEGHTSSVIMVAFGVELK